MNDASHEAADAHEETSAHSRRPFATPIPVRVKHESSKLTILVGILSMGIMGAGFVGIGYDTHKMRLDVEATNGRLDTLTAHVDGLVVLAPQSELHALCVVVQGKHVIRMAGPQPGAIDLGKPFQCPNPDDGVCVRHPNGDVMLAQVATARCEAGKL